jgi:hypothetical protein
MTNASHPPQVRSWLITEVLQYLAPEVRPRFMLQVGSELRALLERGRRDREAWAPLALFHEAMVTADAVSGKGDLEVCWHIGHFIARHESGAVRSLALKLLRPSVLLSLSSSLWQVHYRNAGRAVTHVTGPRAIRLSIVDYPIPHRAHCLSVAGWVHGALEIGRRRAIRVDKIACRCERAASCDFHISWEE